VRDQLGERIRLIIDGGQAQVGIESTVVDVMADPPRLLRPGMIHDEALLAVTGRLRHGAGEGAEILKSPGLLLKHYAPKARLIMVSWSDEDDLQRQLAGRVTCAGRIHVIAHTRVPSGDRYGGVSVIPHDAQAFARALYAELHRCDAAGAETIVVESVPSGPEWQAITDRLRRAASDDGRATGSGNAMI